MSVLWFCVFPLTLPFFGICFCPIRTRPVLGHAGPCPAVWPGCSPTEGPSGKAASGEASSQGLFSALILLKKIDTGQSAPAGHTSADGLPLGLCFPNLDTSCPRSPHIHSPPTSNQAAQVEPKLGSSIQHSPGSLGEKAGLGTGARSPLSTVAAPLKTRVLCSRPGSLEYCSDFLSASFR